MSVKRFESIQRCIHLVDNENLERDPTSLNFDKLAKTRWLIDFFSQRSNELYNMEEIICVDELIIPYKGKYCRIRQFLRNKPIRFGIKVWCSASSKSRFVNQIEVYEGKGHMMGEEGMGFEVVAILVKGLENLWYIVITDNLFTSPRLLHYLMLKGSGGLEHARQTV
jgi:hypothetical protein